MIDLKITVATIVSAEDPEAWGRLKIRAITEHFDVSEDMLPFAIPFHGGYVSDTNITYDSCVPGDKVWLLYEDDGRFDPCYYIPFFSLPEAFNLNVLTDKLSNVSGLSDFDKASIFIKLYDNGDIEFRNKANGDSVLLKDAKTYVYFKGTGEIEVSTVEKEVKITNAKGSLVLGSDGEVSMENSSSEFILSPTGLVTLSNTVESLADILSQIVKDIQGLTTTGSAAAQAASPATVASMAAILLRLQNLFDLPAPEIP